MKILLSKITINEYKKHLSGFENTLSIINYNKIVRKNAVSHLTELFYCLEQKQITSIKQIQAKNIRWFFEEYLPYRENYKKKQGGIKNNTINRYLSAVNMFNNQYAVKNNLRPIPVPVGYLPRETGEIEILQVEEIKLLFETALYQENKQDSMLDLALLGVLYGAGLRRTEAEQLNVEDIKSDQQLILVTGKNYRQRYVPVNTDIMQFLNNYINYCRDELLAHLNDKALFISRGGIHWGKRLSGQSINSRMQRLAGLAQLSKKVYPHLFRHTIATHLLINGMNIYDLKNFLGHKSIESTQVYLHLAESIKSNKNHKT